MSGLPLIVLSGFSRIVAAQHLTFFAATKTDPEQPAEPRKSRVMIVDDHPLFRLGLADLINAEQDLASCCEASSSPGALRVMRMCPPDAAIVDISLPGINGIELIKIVKAELPKLPILVLSMYDEEHYALRALRAGALGYLTKSEALDNVLGALRKVLLGGIYVSPQFSEQLLRQSIQSEDERGDSLESRLSPRELEVLELFGRGLGMREIAAKLEISPKTIETHRRHIGRKFGFKSSAEMRHFAFNWVDLNERGPP
jgi:DNA-binding NarL/FixJ family response regulator